jgi:tRNA threonylcarbamoyladenosine modification (KEOPS) complex  Pcc1 subunit
MPTNIGPHVKSFNERVKIMNQTGRQDITLSAQDARNLHADICSLLVLIAELTNKVQVTDEDITTEVTMDGGKF